MNRRSTKRVDPFYRSAAWARLRMQVLRRDRHRCRQCGETRGQMHVDHVLGRRQRPDLALDAGNLLTLCHACHSAKTARYEGGFGNAKREPGGGCDAEGNPTGSREHW